MIYDKGKRLIAAAICALLLFSAMPFQMVSASDIQDNQNDQTNVETQQQGNTTQKDTEQVEVSNDNQDLIEGNENAQMPKDSQKDFEGNVQDENDFINQENLPTEDVKINYIYVESPYLETPAEEKVVLSIGEGNENISDITLICERSDGVSFEWKANTNTGNLFLFNKEFAEGDTGTYKFVGVNYVQDNVAYNIVLDDIGIEAEFGVNKTYEGYQAIESSNQGDVPISEVEASIVTISTEDEKTTEEQIEGKLDEAKAVMDKSMVKSRSTRNIERNGKNLTIVLDPGHGGSDGGAAANGLVEKNLNLAIAMYCKQELETYSGVTVYMTRSDDRDVGLSERVTLAKNWGADIFVSLHINSASPGATGAEVWYPNSSYNSGIHSEGKELADKIEKELENLGLTSRGIKIRNSENGTTYADGSIADYYSVIRDSKINGFPGIIVEHAFITNQNDAAKLKQESFLKQLGIADATGIAKSYDLRKKGETLLSVGDISDFDNTYHIQVDTSLSGISRVVASIWKNGDVNSAKEYELKSEGNGRYLADVNKGDFNNEPGEYKAQAMIYYNDGSKATNIVTYNLSSAEVKVDITLAKDEMNANETVTVEGISEQLKGIKTAVWGKKDGQNDLRWYTGKQNSSGAWEADIDIRNHKESGEYIADTYVILSNGSSLCVNSSRFEVSEPSLQVTIGEYDAESGTFELTAHDIASPSGVSGIRFPVWESSGQGSSIYWYDAKRQEDGTYKAVVNVKNHQYRKGTYKVHAYLTSGNGILAGIVAGDREVTMAQANVEIKDLAGTQKTYHYSARNYGVLGATGCRIAVWGKKDGQNDLRWYTGKQNSSGAWEADIDIRNHKESGEYVADTYVILSNGSSLCVNSSRFEVSEPSLQVTIGEYDAESGTFELTAHDIASPSGVSGIRFPVWESSDQGSSIYWYDAKRQEDGTYKAVVNVKNHQYRKGTYKVHAYLTSGNGILAGIVAGDREVTMAQANVEIKDLAGTQKTYHYSARNYGVLGATGCRIAVWGKKDGQNDLRWYTGKQNSSGAWEADIDIRNHKESGEYVADTYVILSNGSSLCVNSSRFEVSEPSLQVTIGEYDAESGTFELTAHDIASPSGVSGIRFPVWESSDQGSSIYWYDAKRQEDGTYKAVVNVKNHQYRKGTYKVHAYLTSGNGILAGIVAGDREVTMAQANVEIKDLAGTQKTYHYSARNYGVLGATGCRIAVWGKKDGQNDLRWYTGKQNSSGAWEADIDIRNHKESGEYVADTYVILSNGSSLCVNSSRFEVSEPSLQVTIGEYDAESGTFELTAHDIASPSGVSGIRFPVWESSDQGSSIYWYDAKRQEDGTYKAVVNVKNHQYRKGTYKVHAYLTSGNEVQAGIDIGKIQIDTIIIKELYPIMGGSSVNVEQLVSYFSNSGREYPSKDLSKGGASTINELCKIVYEEAIAEGVKPEVLFAQMMLETGFLEFKGDVKISQFNFGGIGATGGVPGNAFTNVRIGIRAQVQHLKCYACEEPLNNANVDPRWWTELRNKAPYVEWLSIPNNPYKRGWASDPDYGTKLLTMISNIKSQ